MAAERAAHHVGEHAPAPDEIGLLEDHAEREARVAHRATGQTGEILASEQNTAGGGAEYARDAAKERRFAAAVVAEDDEQFAL